MSNGTCVFLALIRKGVDMFSKEQQELIDSLEVQNFPTQWFKETDSLTTMLTKFTAVQNGVNLHRLDSIEDDDKYNVLLTCLVSGVVIDGLLNNLHCSTEQFQALASYTAVKQGHKITNKETLDRMKPKTSEVYKLFSRMASLGLDTLPFSLGLKSLAEARELLRSKIKERQQQINALLKYYHSAGYSSTQLSALRIGMNKCETLIWFGSEGVIKQNYSEEDIYCIVNGFKRGFDFSKYLDKNYTIMQLNMLLRMDKLNLDLSIVDHSFPAPLLKSYCDYMERFNLYERYNQEQEFREGKPLDDIYEEDMAEVDYIRACRKTDQGIHWINQLEELVCKGKKASTFINEPISM